MRIMLWILGGLVLFLVLIAVIGALMPKAHVAASSARYRQSPEVVWAAVTNYREFPAWRSDVKSVEPLELGPGRTGWKERGSQGDLPLEIVESQPPARLVTRIADPKLPYGGTWTYQISGSESGTTVTITENGEVYNPVFRFVSRVFMGQNTTLNQYLRALGRKFGEETQPEVKP